jgi:murein DD-endopeptidase MepM/ murein hydrolase activator NlpD
VNRGSRGGRIARVAACLLLLASAAAAAPPDGPSASGRRDCDLTPYLDAIRHARHDDRVRYQLPFPPEIPRLCTQGPGGPTHKGRVYYAFDFVMPEDTPVVAARAGRVICVVDGHGEGTFSEEALGQANYVDVLHDDGTVAEYAHLRAGIPARAGQAVRVGDVLGYSGNSGYSNGPHLHFAVWHPHPKRGSTSTHVLFGQAGTAGFVPQAGSFYGARPPSRIALAVQADGAPLEDGQPLSLPRGGSVKLRVFWLPPGRRPLELTRAPLMRIEPVTPWTLEVEPGGVLHARPSRGFERSPDREQTRGQVFLVHGRPGGRRYGWRILDVRFESPAPEPGGAAPPTPPAR